MVQLIKNKGMIIFVIVLMAILLAATIALVYVSKQIPIKPGDVIIEKYYYDNPFIDNTFNYETVYAVKKATIIVGISRVIHQINSVIKQSIKVNLQANMKPERDFGMVIGLLLTTLTTLINRKLMFLRQMNQ